MYNDGSVNHWNHWKSVAICSTTFWTFPHINDLGTSNTPCIFQKYEKLAHLKFPSQGQFTFHLFIWLTSQKKKHVLAQTLLQSVWSIQVQFGHIYKGRVNLQQGFGASYFGTYHFSYPMVLDTGTNHKYIDKSELNYIIYNMKLHKTLPLAIIDSLLRKYTRWQ